MSKPIHILLIIILIQVCIMNNKTIQVGCIYTGAVLGAGFATGLELFTYFVSYGPIGFLGLTICCLLFIITGYKVLKICHENKIYDYTRLMDLISGKFLSPMFRILSFLFLNVLFSAMLAGFGELVQDIFHIPAFYGNTALAIISLFLLVGGENLLAVINTALCPFLIIGCIILGIYIFWDTTAVFSINKAMKNNFLTSAIIYTSYNTITSVALLAQISDRIADKRQALASAALCGILLLMAGVAMCLPLYFNPQINNNPLPILSLINSNMIKWCYTLVLTLAIVTTAVGNGFCIAEFYSKSLCIKKKSGCFLACCVGLMLSSIGFNQIVNNVYFVFGVVGLGQMVCLLAYRSEKN